MKYEVAAADTFQPQFFPEVETELRKMSGQLKQIPGEQKAEIVISFLKDHCIKTDCFKGNSDVIKLVTSRALEAAHIEALFKSCNGNHAFTADLEKCIKASLR